MEIRELLLRTAERLYGERGLNGVSLREIGREAGQRNVSAVRYHFGSREGMIEAIFERRMSMLDQRRVELLDALESTGESNDLAAIIGCFLAPLVELLRRDEDASQYVRFLTEMILSREFRVGDYVEGKYDHGTRRGYQLIEAVLPNVPPRILKQRVVIAMHGATFSLADIEAERVHRGVAFDADRAVCNVVDMLMGSLTAPVSDHFATRLGAG